MWLEGVFFLCLGSRIKLVQLGLTGSDIFEKEKEESTSTRCLSATCGSGGQLAAAGVVPNLMAKEGKLVTLRSLHPFGNI